MPLSPPSRERQGGVNRVPQALQACILVLTQLASTRLPGRSKPRPYVIFSGEVLLPLTPYLSPLTSYLLPLTSYLLPLTSYLSMLKMVNIPHLTCILPILTLSLPTKHKNITNYHETQQANMALRVMQGV